MATAPAHASVLRFGSFEVDPCTGELRKNGALVKLQPQPARVLVLLASRPGELVTRDELKEALWGQETFVDFEQGLNSCIRQIRNALGDDPDNPRFVQTLPRHGYRFIASVTQRSAHAMDVAPPDSKSNQYSSRRMWLITAGLIAAAAVALAYLAASGRPGSQAIQSIAVLPLANLSADASEEYFSDGLTDELITNLAQAGSLQVISRTSIVGYKHSTKKTAEIARELGVDALVEGTVQRAGDRIRIRVQLIRAAEDHHLWAQSYDRSIGDALAVQEEIARAIASQIQFRITPARAPALNQRPLVSVEAEDAYLHGRYELNKWTPAGLRSAVEWFRKATDVEPNYARAYAGMAEANILLGAYAVLAPAEANARARTAALRALEIDDGIAQAHAALGIVYTSDWNWPAAEREFKRALQLNPNYAFAHVAYGFYLRTMGKMEASIQEGARAEQVDPRSPSALLSKATSLYFARRYAEAAQQCRRVLELDNTNVSAKLTLAGALSFGGKPEEGLREWIDALEIQEGKQFADALRHDYKRLGYSAGLRVIRKKLLAYYLQRTQHVRPLDIGQLALDERGPEEFFPWLDKAYREHSFQVLELNLDPSYDAVRNDPRFQAVVRAIGLPQTTSPE